MTRTFSLVATAVSVALLSWTSFSANAQNQPAAPAPASLDALLQQVQGADQRDAEANKAREAQFAQARDQQASLLATAKKDKDGLDAQSTALQKQFEDNDKQIATLSQSRDAAAGNLGELFGVMRQSAGDFASAARNSMLSVQFPERIAQLDRLAQTKTMPPMEDLHRFWFEMQREMTEGGKVVRFDASVTAPDGTKEKKSVLRVGPFVAISDGQFLAYDTGADSFSVPPKQPPHHFRSIASSFEGENAGYQKMVVDPTRGVLIGLFSQRPEVIDRIRLGGWIAYVILTVGFIGSVLAIYQFFYLTRTSSQVNSQLSHMERLTPDNPLGRVMLSFKGQGVPKDEDAEVVELRISEAVLKELPPIQRIQPFLKLVVAAGPLLGLVGTVIGMIETFQSITESGSGDPKLMAAGIGRAMIATVLGLGVAIPMLFINSALASRSKRLVQILDQQSTGLLAETLEARQATPMLDTLLAPLTAVEALMGAGGQLVAWIFVAGVTMWTLIFERLWFFRTKLPSLTEEALKYWQSRPEHKSWASHQVRKAIISRINGEMSANLPMLKVLVPLCPLLGLVGTVTGMLEVFDSMAILGSADARTMASGVSKAMNCTMTGLAVSVSGMYPVFQFQAAIRRQTELLADRFKF